MRRKKTMYLILLMLVLMISIGYAMLSVNLSINGTSKISNARWDVHFENAQATSNSTVTPTTAPSAPAAEKVTTISYDVTFNVPGDIYEFTVDVVNGGSIDAMIESFASKMKIGDAEEVAITSDQSNLPSYLDYDVTYEDGTAIKNNHELKADTSETILVHIEFKKDITNAELQEASGKIIELNVRLNYKQADGTETETHQFTGTKYTVNRFPSIVSLNSAIPNSITKYATPEEAVSAFNNRQYYLKHKIENGIVKESYVEFVITEEMAAENDEMRAGTYTLRGGVDESSLEDRPIFIQNAETLYEAFERCNLDPDYFGSTNTFDMQCWLSSGEGWFVDIDTSGKVQVTWINSIDSERNIACSVYGDDGTSYCLE